MSKDTEEKNIRDNLKYIGLDLDNIPQILKQEYNIKTFKFYENKTCKIYKYVPISKIKILLTSANRLESINKRYSKVSICNGLFNSDNNLEKSLNETNFVLFFCKSSAQF